MLGEFQGCSISIIGNGYITAQGRCNTNDANGFVFRNCNVLGNGKGITFLGRPWRAYARVLFYNCNFSDVINPVGWDPWGYGGSQAYVLLLLLPLFFSYLRPTFILDAKFIKLKIKLSGLDRPIYHLTIKILLYTIIYNSIVI